MAVKKYFIDNAVYGVEALNKIVAGLRTTGVDGETANSLLVSKNGELAVNIAPGRGWVDGCQIELNATESRAVGSAAGTYSVIMQLSKTGEQTDDIDIAVQEGSVTGAHVLAYVTVSGGQITAIADRRINSKFRGNTSSVNPDGLAEWEPGPYVLFSDLDEKRFSVGPKMETDSSFVKLMEYQVSNGGTVDVRFYFKPSHWNIYDMSVASDTLQANLKIHVDGKDVGDTVTATGTSEYTAGVIRVNVSAGSTVEIWGRTKRSGSSNYGIYLRGIKFCIAQKSSTVARVL